MEQHTRSSGAEWLSPGRIRLLLGLEILLGVLTSFLFLGSKSVWLDESFSIGFARDLSRMLAHDGNAWLYYGLLHLWIKLGSSEFMVRALSAVFAVAAIPVVYATGRDLWDARAGLIAGLLFPLNRFVIEYAQEARGYILVVFFSALATMFFVRGMQRPRPGTWLGYALAGAAAVYSHMFGALAMVAHGTSLVMFRWRDIPWRHLIVSGAAMALFLVPLALGQPGESQIHWIPPFQLQDLYLVVVSLAGDSRLILLIYAVGSALALVALLRVRLRPSREAWAYVLPILLVAVPLAAGAAVSLIKTPVMLPRYYVICIAPFVILAAAGLAEIRNRYVQAGVLVFAVLVSANNLWRHYASDAGREDWRAAATTVVQGAGRGDAVIFYAYMIRQPFEYYCEQLGVSRDTLHLLELASAPLGTGHGRRSDLPDPREELLDSLGHDARRIWFVRAHELPRLGRDVEGKYIEDRLSATHVCAQEFSFNWVRVQRLERSRLAGSDSTHRSTQSPNFPRRSPEL